MEQQLEQPTSTLSKKRPCAPSRHPDLYKKRYNVLSGKLKRCNAEKQRLTEQIYNLTSTVNDMITTHKTLYFVVVPSTRVFWRGIEECHSRGETSLHVDFTLEGANSYMEMYNTQQRNADEPQGGVTIKEVSTEAFGPIQRISIVNFLLGIGSAYQFGFPMP